MTAGGVFKLTETHEAHVGVAHRNAGKDVRITVVGEENGRKEMLRSKPFARKPVEPREIAGEGLRVSCGGFFTGQVGDGLQAGIGSDDENASRGRPRCGIPGRCADGEKIQGL